MRKSLVFIFTIMTFWSAYGQKTKIELEIAALKKQIDLDYKYFLEQRKNYKPNKSVIRHRKDLKRLMDKTNFSKQDAEKLIFLSQIYPPENSVELTKIYGDLIFKGFRDQPKIMISNLSIGKLKLDFVKTSFEVADIKTGQIKLFNNQLDRLDYQDKTRLKIIQTIKQTLKLKLIALEGKTRIKDD